jgi:hypothetical protein
MAAVRALFEAWWQLSVAFWTIFNHFLYNEINRLRCLIVPRTILIIKIKTDYQTMQSEYQR